MSRQGVGFFIVQYGSESGIYRSVGAGCKWRDLGRKIVAFG